MHLDIINQFQQVKYFWKLKIKEQNFLGKEMKEKKKLQQIKENR